MVHLPPHLDSTCLEDTTIFINVIVISLVFYFLPIVVEVQIHQEYVVIVPTNWICILSLMKEFGIGVDVHQCLGFVDPKMVATFIMNK